MHLGAIKMSMVNVLLSRLQALRSNLDNLASELLAVAESFSSLISDGVSFDRMVYHVLYL